MIAITASPGRAVTAGDARDQPYLSTIVNQALETERTNVPIPWSNPETGHRGELVIERTWYRDPQSPCRDYRWTLERSGRPAETIAGTGCRIGPAVWRLEERPLRTPLSVPDPSAPLPSPGTAPPASAPDPAAVPDTAAAPPVSSESRAAAPSAASPAATHTAKAEPVRKRPAPVAKTQSSATGGDNTAAKPAPLPSYTLPSRTAM
ncbi:MAG TPA: RT0821/Lpp0805 family surface protein [Rhodospirillales bacterium]|nr:RT0821/Lpp0805 family surface protein [Rhodospirillales bacterium]